jgi:hypothetical protein
MRRVPAHNQIVPGRPDPDSKLPPLQIPNSELSRFQISDQSGVFADIEQIEMPKTPHRSEICICEEPRNLLLMELFDSLLDDEILLRRPETPVAAALAQHRELRNAYAPALATLVVPDSRLTEITRQVPPGASIPVSVITSGGAGGLLALARHHTAGAELASVEPTLRDLDDLAGSAARMVSAAGELSPEVTVFIGLPYAPGWEAAVDAIEAAGLCGKIAAADADPRQVVEQLSILIEADLPFKITSSLEGDLMALLTAVEALVAGASRDDVAELMRLDDHDRFGKAVSSWDLMTQSRVRRRVRRLGTDRVQDVIDNLNMRTELPAP